MRESRKHAIARPIGGVAAVVALLAALVVASAGPAGASPGQVVTPLGGGLTPAQLVEQFLGEGITASNVTYQGADVAAGTFTGMGAIGFASGIVLSSGTAGDVVGPNTSEGTSTELDEAGDADLDLIVAPDTTEDAAVLEFDFVPSTTQVQFQYVFSSEEYNEFVYEFNDVFAFFVNGTNCATVPGSNPVQAVAINTINGGKPFGTNPSNASLYRNNSTSDPGPPTIDTQMDGLTTVLTCSATVTAGETNHMKLAVADTNDQELDTAVFLRAASFEAPTPPTCAAQSVTTLQDTAVGVALAASDVNVGDILTYTTTSPAHGTLSGTAPALTYTPNAGFTGSDSFTYTANDGSASCDPAGVVSISVTAPTPTSTAPPAADVEATPQFTG
jgi:hypothetical protein